MKEKEELRCYLCGRSEEHLRPILRGSHVVFVCLSCYELFEQNIVIKCQCGAINLLGRTYENFLRLSLLRDAWYLEWALKRRSIFLMDANGCPNCAPTRGFSFSGGEGRSIDLSWRFCEIANYFTKEQFTISEEPEDLVFALDYKL